MAYSFGRLSLERLATCATPIQTVMHAVMARQIMDFTIVVGHRGKADQNLAYARGNSKLQWPNSRHNSLPSEAIDIMPHPTGWKRTEPFYLLAGLVLLEAASLDIPLRWGGNWDMDNDLFDNKLTDLAHFELLQS